jgi:hypothetical protein
LKRLFTIPALLFLNAGLLISQNLKITGIVSDSALAEPLIGATIYLQEASTGTVTNTEGYFSLDAAKGRIALTFSYIGYTTVRIDTFITANTRLDVRLSQAVIRSGDVVISAKNTSASTNNTRTGMLELTAKDIKSLPSFMGEADLIRALHYSPGIQSSGDGNSGFYVRGGNVDQNLILLDNALVYNPSHVLGFFSVFNSDIISNATLIKSGMPPNYGGRISSVLTVKTIEGDYEKHHAQGTLGLIYSKASIQGPVIKNKLSYVVSFRKSYVNEVLKPLAELFVKPDSGGILNGSSYGMYDLNAKISGRISSKDRIGLNFYKGRDNFNLNREDIDYKTKIGWGNTLLSLNWNHISTDSAYWQNTLSYSKYDFGYNAEQFIISMDLYSSVSNWNYRLEYNRQTKNMGTIRAGLEAKYYTFVPNRFMLTINQVDLNYSNYQDLMAFEGAAFFSWEKDINPLIRLMAGIRLNNYRQLGPYNQYNLNEGQIQDTVVYGNFKTVQSYSNPEPRLSVRFRTSGNSSVKASYTRNYQYIHVASASSVTMPSDIWIPSTSNTKPQFGDQFTLGYYRNMFSNAIITSVEAYYKNLRNQVELLYGLGASLQDVSFENSLTSGKGYATGIEFFIQKPAGRITGTVGYSLAYSRRQFDEINFGNPFPAKYDRRHEVNLTSSYKLNQRWDLSVAFIYATGNAITVPVQMYIFDNNINTEYSATNGYRMPPYHRLDVSANYLIKKTEKFESSLNISVLNVYNRANPFLVYFDIRGDIVNEHSLSVKPKQISILPVMPSVSWNFKF